MLKKAFLHFFQNNFPTFVLIFLGTVCWAITMVKSGLMYSFGLGFWGANGHDGIWHIAIAEALSRGSFEMPGFAGSAIQNYHLGFGILLALAHRLTDIPIPVWYFQIFPIIFSILIGILTYKFVLDWRGSKAEANWSLFFVYFGSSFGFVVTYLRSREITGDSMFWAQQALSTLINPPFALSLIFILSGLIFLQRYLRTHSTLYFLLAAIFFGLLIQIKAYAGVLVLLGLGAATLWQLITKKKVSLFKITLLSGLISVLVSLPFLKESAGIFTFQPFWFLETMMTYSDRLNWEKFYSAMTNYRAGKIWGKAILAYGAAFVIFIIGNLGSRIIGLFSLVKIKLAEIEVLIFTILFFAVAIPTFFVQKGTPWNSIQFFYYFIFFFSIFAGISAAKMRKVLAIFLILFSIIGVWSSLRHYWPSTSPAKLSPGEVEALKFLAGEPPGVVLTYPFDRDQSNAAAAAGIAPRPLYLYESTAYVSAYGKHPVFLEDEVNLDITGYPWKDRKASILSFYNSLDISSDYTFLRANNITYVYWLRFQHARVGDTELGLTKIFENKDVWIFKLKEK
jgi:hypothetical protein